MQQGSLKFTAEQAEVAKVRRQLVAYDMPVDLDHWSQLALVGEAPGEEEARLGHPFVGRSGQLLDKMLGKAGIDRTQCLVANVFRSRPPDNKVDHFFISKRAAVQQGIAIAEEYGQFGTAWCRAEFAEDIEHLRDTLAQLKPRAILTLGRTPMWALTGEKGMLEKAGQELTCRLMPGVPVIPTYHPSFILRGNWELQDQWLAHFHAAKQKTN